MKQLHQRRDEETPITTTETPPYSPKSLKHTSSNRYLLRSISYLLKEQRLLFILIGIFIGSTFVLFKPTITTISQSNPTDPLKPISLSGRDSLPRFNFNRPVGQTVGRVPVSIGRKRRRVVVTGGSGFVGSHLVDKLIARGDDVIVIDNFFTGRKENVMHHFNNPRFELIRHDVVEPILLEVDQIYHLACPASPVHYKYNPVKTIKTNVMGTLNMLGLAKRIGARFLLTSTSEVYGDPLEHPQKETYWGHGSDGSGIQGDFDLNNFRDGVISSAFMVGLLVASPIFASLAKSINPFRLIGVGLSVWTLAAAGCGLSVDFWSITLCRMLVGVGEASFISLAAPFIDDNAPVAQRTAWLGIFYMCIPTGIAVGYVYGGVVGGSVGWRYAFFGEAILMLPFAILGFAMKPLQMKGMSHDKNFHGSIDEEGGEHIAKERSSYSSFSNQLSRFWQDIKALLLEKVYVINVLGYIAYNFVIGAYSYWGPKAGYSIYQMENADILFGGITIIGGIVGTLGGSIILDRMNSTIPNAFKLLSTATFLGAIFCFSAFCFSNLYIYIGLFLIGEILVFATQGPVNFVCLHTVKPSLRPLSMAMSTVSIHVFGDVPSSPLVGLLQDKVNNWRISALILTSVFFLAAGIWFIGIFLDSADRYDEGGEHAGSAVEQPDVMPLLKNKPATASP